MKQNSSKKQARQSGVSLIESLIAIFLLMVISISLYGMFLLAGELVADAKLRTMGIYAGNEEMENIKSMTYRNVGTNGGVPSGILPQFKVVQKGGYSFEVRTDIRFADDDVDGVFPADTIPTDYKSVRVEVTWQSPFQSHEVVLVSSIYPDTPEEDVSGGILSINAIDFSGQGVSDCDADVENASLSPPVSIHTKTDDQGNIILMGMPPSVGGYKITLSRAGHETVQTYPPYPDTAFYPVDENATVIQGWLNTKTVRIDEVGDISITVRDEADNTRGGFLLNVTGGRILGYTEETAPDRLPIYSYDHDNVATNASGVLEIDDTSPGSYTIELADPDYQIVGFSPTNPFVLESGGSSSPSITAVAKTTNSLLVKVYDSETREPVPDASVAVTGPDFSATRVADSMGYAFF